MRSDGLPDPPPQNQINRELDELLEAGEVLVLTLDALQVLALLSHLQLACRHPHAIGPSTAIARRIAQALEVWLARQPGLADLTAMGWNPAYDVPPGRPAP